MNTVSLVRTATCANCITCMLLHVRLCTFIEMPLILEMSLKKKTTR